MTEFCLGPSIASRPGGITAGPDGALWYLSTGLGGRRDRIGRVSLENDGMGHSRAPRSAITDRPFYALRRGIRPHVRGRSCDDDAVARIELSLTRMTSRGPVSCLALSSRGHWLRYRPTRARCTPRFTIAARGTNRWRLRLPRRLTAGRYTLTSRATNNTGQRETRFSHWRGNVSTLRVD